MCIRVDCCQGSERLCRVRSRHERARYRCPLWVNSGHLRGRRTCPLYPRKRTFSVGTSISAKCQKRTYLCAPFVGEQRQLKNPVERRKGNADFKGTRDLAIFSVLEPQGESGVSVSCRRPQHGGHNHDHCLRTALVGFSNLRSAGRCMRQRIHQTQSEQLRLDCSGYGRSGSRLNSARGHADCSVREVALGYSHNAERRALRSLQWVHFKRHAIKSSDVCMSR